MKIKLLLVLLFSLLFTNLSLSAQEKQIIRVGISNQNFSNYEHKTVKISSQGEIKIIDMFQNAQIDIFEPSAIVEISFQDGLYNIIFNDEMKYKNLQGPLLINSNEDLQILELNRKGIPAKYKGMLEIRNTKSNQGFHIINIIDMQNYLRGVVSNEMPISFGLEALKAQSVAARNYANNAQISEFYDVVDSTASQVYYGSNSYKDLADLAVYQTNGIYALYDEKPITALYFSTSTGITDDWDDVFGNGTYSGKHPYLKARFDYENKPIKNEKDAVEFLSKNDNGYDIDSPKFRWNFEFERLELEEILHTTLQQQSKLGFVKPAYDGEVKIEGIKEIKPLKRTQSGKITELEIVSKTGNYKINTQLAIRRVFKKNNVALPSTAFFVEESRKKETIKEDNNEVDEINFSIFSDENKYPKTFNIIGGGFGHGVGMSQYGAKNLAKMGKKYPEILNHYYSDIKISTMPKEVEYNEHNIFYKTDFYFESNIHKKAYLYISNQRGIENYPFKINEYEFLDTTKISDNKVVKIDISQYLKEGNNTITFVPLTRENKGKHLTYRIEFNNEQ